MKKKIAAAMALIMLFSSAALTGCGEKDSSTSQKSADEQVLDTATLEVRQNDYRGGVMRTYALKDNVLKIMENMKQNNTIIRTNSPNSFWTTDGYQDFVVNFLSAAIISDTQWFNEEETDWATVTKQMVSVQNSFTQVSSDSETGYASKYSGMSIVRNEKDDYSITGISDSWSADSTSGGSTYSGKFIYRILYDCDKDWCKAYSNMSINADVPDITAELFEYARIDNNTFAIQTSKERLVVVLENAEQDTDIRSRTIKEFYYSKLTSEGARTTFEPYEDLPEYDSVTGAYISSNARRNEMMKSYSVLNENGDLSLQYGKGDSMFLTGDIVKDVNGKWVFADKSLQQAIVYKDGALVATTFNKLSESYERFVYATAEASESTISEIEKMVEIKDLVGIQEISKSFVTSDPDANTETEAGTEPAQTFITENETSDVTTAPSDSDSPAETVTTVENAFPNEE